MAVSLPKLHLMHWSTARIKQRCQCQLTGRGCLARPQTLVSPRESARLRTSSISITQTMLTAMLLWHIARMG